MNLGKINVVSAILLSLFPEATALIWKSLQIQRISLFWERSQAWRRNALGLGGGDRLPWGRPWRRVSELHPITRVPFSHAEVAQWKGRQSCFWGRQRPAW